MFDGTYRKGYAKVNYYDNTSTHYLPKYKKKKQKHKDKQCQKIEKEIRLKQFIEEFYKIPVILNIRNYETYLLTKEWKERSLLVKRYNGMKCCKCHSGPMDHWKLNAHHLTYERIGAERFDDLICLCWRCHKKVHSI